MGLLDKVKDVNPIAKLDKRTDEEKETAAQERAANKELKAEQKEERRDAKDAQNRAKAAAIVVNAKLLDPIGSLPGNMMVVLALDPSGLYIRDAKSNIAVIVPYTKISFARHYSETEIKKEIEYQQKNKSVVGRGVAGAVLFGGVGAMIGGMSALQPTIKKKVKKTESTSYFFIVNYKPEPNAFAVAVSFELSKIPAMSKFEAELTQRAYECGGLQTVTTL